MTKQEVEEAIGELIWEVVQRLKREEPEKYQELLQNLKDKEAKDVSTRRN